MYIFVFLHENANLSNKVDPFSESVPIGRCITIQEASLSHFVDACSGSSPSLTVKVDRSCRGKGHLDAFGRVDIDTKENTKVEHLRCVMAM